MPPMINTLQSIHDPIPEELTGPVAAAKVVAEKFEARGVAVITLKDTPTPEKPNSTTIQATVWNLTKQEMIAAHIRCLEQVMGTRIACVSYENGYVSMPHMDLIPPELLEQIMGGKPANDNDAFDAGDDDPQNEEGS